VLYKLIQLMNINKSLTYPILNYYKKKTK
jgi:hypothetical protein